MPSPPFVCPCRYYFASFTITCLFLPVYNQYLFLSLFPQYLLIRDASWNWSEGLKILNYGLKITYQGLPPPPPPFPFSLSLPLSCMIFPIPTSPKYLNSLLYLLNHLFPLSPLHFYSSSFNYFVSSVYPTTILVSIPYIPSLVYNDIQNTGILTQMNTRHFPNSLQRPICFWTIKHFENYT